MIPRDGYDEALERYRAVEAALDDGLADGTLTGADLGLVEIELDAAARAMRESGDGEAPHPEPTC